jgi:uncharacterized protein YdaU (DUF1376 family)
MHFYEFNIGDYAKKTQHLTNEEDLAYRRLLDMYYDSENPVLTTGLATLSRRLRVDEKALKNILDEFFPDGKNKHADEKISEYHAYLERQKSNGSKGGRPKHKPTDNPPLTQNNPVPSQPLTTKPLTTNQEPIKNTSASCDAGIGVEYSKAFITFWDMYPVKKNKGLAYKSFKKIKPAEYPAIKAGLLEAQKSDAWIKDNGKFIPHPSSWLNARGWEDEHVKSTVKKPWE